MHDHRCVDIYLHVQALAINCTPSDGDKRENHYRNQQCLMLANKILFGAFFQSKTTCRCSLKCNLFDSIEFLLRTIQFYSGKWSLLLLKLLYLREQEKSTGWIIVTIAQWLNTKFWSQTTWTRILVPPLASCDLTLLGLLS